MSASHVNLRMLAEQDVLQRLRELRARQPVKFAAFYSSQLGGIVPFLSVSQTQTIDVDGILDVLEPLLANVLVRPWQFAPHRRPPQNEA